MTEITEICLENKEKYILVTFSNDNHIVVLDFLTLDIIHALTGHEAKIVSLHFDHNFKQLVSLGKDRTARVWQFDQIIDNEIKHPKITKKIKKGPVLAIAYDKVKQIYATSH
jgi:WD40 repeat protein